MATAPDKKLSCIASKCDRICGLFGVFIWELWRFVAIRCHPYMLHDSRRSKVVEKLGVGPEAAHEPTQSDHA